jgi:hypothetical protein
VVQRFVEIFGEQTLDGRVEFETMHEMAESAGWTVLRPGELIRLDESGRSIVISGVTWSKPDLELLDELATRDTVGTQVWFFNPDQVFPDDRILPGAPRMVQTPALAEYSGEQLVSFLQGGRVHGRIRDLFPSRSSA